MSLSSVGLPAPGGPGSVSEAANLPAGFTYVDTLAADRDVPNASFAICRALDATGAQHQQRKTRRLTLPVLGIGGAHSPGNRSRTR